MPKFGNKKVSLDGYSFASKLEASVYHILKLRMKAEEIDSIQVQDHVYLTRARILYIADFKCMTPDGNYFYVESKGYSDQKWPLKKKLWKFYGPGKLEVWMGSYNKPYLAEEIIPMEETDTRDETIKHLRDKVEELTQRLEDLKKVLKSTPIEVIPEETL